MVEASGRIPYRRYRGRQKIRGSNFLPENVTAPRQPGSRFLDDFEHTPQT